MGVTAFSFILLPLSILWFSQPLRLLQLLLIMAIFEAAAALTIGGLGLQPDIVPSIAFIAYVGLQLLLGAQYPGAHMAWRSCIPFLLFTAWALATSYFMPHVFEGRIYVWPQKVAPPFVASLLEPSPSNINQDIYLLLNTALLTTGAIFLTRSRFPLRSVLNAYFISGFVAAGVSVWQLANKIAGVPYPESLFYSNPGWAILTGQSIGAAPRINGSFSEPASLGSYMASIVCSTGWLMILGRRSGMVPVLFVVALLCVTISTSTTGFATLALAVVGICLYAVITGSARMTAGIIKIGIPVLLLVGLLTVASAAFAPAIISSAEEVFTATLTKQDSASYEGRTSADTDSLMTGVDTYGLGAGWGSNRSSSLLPGLFASVGVPGLLGLGWFGFDLFKRVRWARRQPNSSADHMMVIDGCCGALVGYILSALISAPTISSATFYLLLALLIGCVARVQIDAQATSIAVRV
jgi:hypothetical protein